MYEDLVETQRMSPLERFVLTSVVPSLLVTSLLHTDVFWTTARPEPVKALSLRHQRKELDRAGDPSVWCQPVVPPESPDGTSSARKPA